MKFSRILAAFLILIMSSGHALAAVCSVSCATMDMDIQQQVLEVEMSGMDMHDCHDTDSSQKQPTSKHQNCTMAGCHFSQVVLDTNAKHQAPKFASVFLPVFISTAISADQPPPIKPPA